MTTDPATPPIDRPLACAPADRRAWLWPWRSPASLACFLLVAAVGLGADLWTKHEAFARLAVEVPGPGGTVDYLRNGVYRFVPGLLHFEVTQNHGAVFGLGQGKRVLFVAVSVVAGGFLAYLFSASGRRHGYQVLLGMLLAGVLGNLYDRVQFGYVRDMIHALPAWGVFPWIFNVADSLLCVGVGLLLVYMVVYPDAGATIHHGEHGGPRRGEEERAEAVNT